jgi:hypothetical protein
MTASLNVKRMHESGKLRYYENSIASANSPEQRVMYATTTNNAATTKTTRFIVAGHRCGDTIAHLLSLSKR